MQQGCEDHAEAYKRYGSTDLECPQCHRFFYGQLCQSCKPASPARPSVCSTRRKCPECPNEPVPPLDVFFDIESMQVEGCHVLNLIEAETETDDFFERYSKDCVPSFLEWLGTLTNNGKRPLTVIVHNFRGYDSYPIIAELHRQKRQLEQVRNGGKVLQLTYDNEGATIRFIDSLSFFTMPLSAFPKTFGLLELKKGFFPHLFNTPTNQEYVGPIPAAEYYMPDGMALSTRQEFDTWYAEQVRIKPPPVNCSKTN